MSSSWPQSLAWARWTSSRSPVFRWDDELRELVRHGFVAELAGEIVGFAALEIYSPKLAEVRSLAVRPDSQGRGTGRQLVDACIGLAQRSGVLEVMAITSEEEFFKTCGFDFTLPGEKKALFLQTRSSHDAPPPGPPSFRS